MRATFVRTVGSYTCLPGEMWMVCRHFCFYKPSKTIHSKFKKAYEQIEGLQETAEYVDRITQT